MRRALLLLAVLTACGPKGPEIQELQVMDAGVRPKGIILFPVALAMPGSTALECVARSNDVALHLMKNTDLPIIGPYDFALNKMVDEARTVSSDTDLLAHKEDLAVEPRDWAVLHLLVTENRATNVRDIEDQRNKDKSKQKTFRQHGLEAIVRVELTLLEPMRGRKLAGLVVEFSDDPTQFEPGGDPRPGITKALQLAVDKLLETSGENLRGTGARRLRGDEALVDSVTAMQLWTAPELVSWQQLNAQKGEVEREAATLSLAERFAPDLSAIDLRTATRGKGVLVRAAKAPLLPGDLVVSVGGKPTLARYQLDRLLQACPASGCQVQIMRMNKPAEVNIAWPQVANNSAQLPVAK